MNEGIEAIRELTTIGYRAFAGEGEVGLEYEADKEPDPAQVLPLLKVVEAHKSEVLAFLKNQTEPDRVPTCADCRFHNYTGPNPRQGWGQCTFHMKGFYGLHPACENYK